MILLAPLVMTNLEVPQDFKFRVGSRCLVYIPLQGEEALPPCPILFDMFGQRVLVHILESKMRAIPTR